MSGAGGFVAEHIAALPFSGIRKFFDVVSTMPEAVSLGVGEPDFETPWRVREAAVYHLERGKTSYTANAGTIELRTAIAGYMRKRFDLAYDPKSEILVTVGASEGIDVALRAILNPGDEVVYVEPCFVSYRPCIVMAGGVPVPVTATHENQFRVTPAQLAAAITPRTKAVLISYPSNPTGAILEEADLVGLAGVLRDKNIVVISDEIYAELTYGAKHVSIANQPGMKEKTIVINGFSKAFAMTGWRLGYACAPAEILSAMLKIHQYVLMCASTTAQYAGVEAMRGGMAAVETMREDYDRRRRFMLSAFAEMGVPCFEPLGAFYTFPSIRETGLTGEAFCERLLFEEKLAVVPGAAFGASGEGFVRCSYAYSIEKLKVAMERFARFIHKVMQEKVQPV